MVKKIKRFIVFCLFSFFFALLSGKGEKRAVSKNDSGSHSWNAADAGLCCPKGTGGHAADATPCCGCSKDGPCYC